MMVKESVNRILSVKRVGGATNAWIPAQKNPLKLFAQIFYKINIQTNTAQTKLE